MNRYFYIPVMNKDVCHDGVSLEDHLRIVDSELYRREQEFQRSISSLNFEDGHLSPKKVNKVALFDQTLDVLYRDRSLVRGLIIVLCESGMYELASEEDIDSIDVEKILSFEITGDDVVTIFSQNLDYPPCVMNFFDAYRKNKGQLKENSSQPTYKKVFQKFPFLGKKNS